MDKTSPTASSKFFRPSGRPVVEWTLGATPLESRPSAGDVLGPEETLMRADAGDLLDGEELDEERQSTRLPSNALVL
jgi:hypothetical protein